MNTLEGNKTQIGRMARTFKPILASSATGDLPTRFQLLKTGIWDTPNHGVFAVTPEDLVQYKENFDNGVAQVIAADGKPDGIQIDYDHMPGVAAGWIKGLKVEGDTLWADPVEWSARGEEDLRGKNFKYISPEFYPASRGGWEDPERYGFYIPNALAAAGLVNRPLFKGLTPIMASANGGNTDDEKNVIYISASEKEKPRMTIEEVRNKNVADLNDEEKAFVAANQADFTDEEKVKFGLKSEIAAVVDETLKNKEETTVETPVVDPELAAIAASVKSGDSVVIKASQLKQFEDTAKEVEVMKREKIAAGVQKHVERGAIKADAADAWTDRIYKDPSMEDVLKEMNGSPVMAGELGTDVKAGDATASASSKITASAKKLMETNTSLKMEDAISQVLRDDPVLAKEYSAESQIK